MPPILVRRAAAAILVLAATTVAGCATPAVMKKFQDREEISSIGLRLKAVRQGEVQIGWRAQIADGSETSGVLTVDEEIQECAAMEVLVAHPLQPPAPLSAVEQIHSVSALMTSQRVDSLWSRVGDRSCKLLLVLRPGGGTHLIDIGVYSRAQKGLAVDTIGAPRHPAWLMLVPATVVADAAVGVLAVSASVVAACAADGKCVEGVVNEAR